MAFNPAELIATIGGFVEKVIPDADKRAELNAQIRLAVIALSNQWTPMNIVGLVAGLSLVLYLNMVGWIGALVGAFVPLVWEVVGLLFIITAIAWGLDAGSIVKLLREWRKDK